MSHSTSLLDLIATGQSQKEVTANALMDAASPAMALGRRAAGCAALTWGYYGGAVMVNGAATLIANGDLLLTASATNYIEFDTLTGVVSKNTTGFTAGRVRLYSVVTGASSVNSYSDWRTGNTSGGSRDAVAGVVFIVNVSAEGANLTTGTSKVTFRAPFAFTLTGLKASLSTASSSGTPTVAVKVNGTSILSTNLTIDVTEKTSATAAVPVVISTPGVADGAEITIDVTVAGTDARALKLYFYAEA